MFIQRQGLKGLNLLNPLAPPLVDLSGILSFTRRYRVSGAQNGGMLGRMLMKNSNLRSDYTQMRFR
jgi:hypothetical protein